MKRLVTEPFLYIFAERGEKMSKATFDLQYEDPIIFKTGGPYSLYCRKCRCWVPNTANAEMIKEGVYSHSHICGVRQKNEVYEELEVKRNTLQNLNLLKFWNPNV